jgi:hypothetical protein
MEGGYGQGSDPGRTGDSRAPGQYGRPRRSRRRLASGSREGPGCRASGFVLMQGIGRCSARRSAKHGRKETLQTRRLARSPATGNASSAQWGRVTARGRSACRASR